MKLRNEYILSRAAAESKLQVVTSEVEGSEEALDEGALLPPRPSTE